MSWEMWFLDRTPERVGKGASWIGGGWDKVGVVTIIAASRHSVSVSFFFDFFLAVNKYV